MNIQSTMMMSMATTMAFVILTLTINKSKEVSKSKNSNFECGFNQKSSSMMPFSSQFFMVALLFLIFDLEITLFIPIMMSESKSITILTWSMIMMINLKMGFMIEWKEGLLEWTKNKNKE